MNSIAAAELQRRLLDGGELALLDVREQGVHYRGHPFFAASLPLSRLELLAADLVPRRAAPIVLFDGGGEGLAETAAERLARFGYGDIAILERGMAGWRDAGFEVFSGVNVPSKAFGEFVEHRYDTPRISAAELDALKRRGADLVILDSRPFDEFQRMSIPGGIDTPGAELVFRVRDMAPKPETLVVVNCAGRTRSIIGAQSLINAGIPNKVVALKDGTMGWELAGLRCTRGENRVAPLPSPAGEAVAREAALRVAQRFGVKSITRAAAQAWLRDPTRTTYLLDVRSPQEFEAGHIAGARQAPGGQLVQATDEYCGVRGARLVLADPKRVRAIMTASWLIQLGWREVRVLEPEGADGFAGWPVARGEHRAAIFGLADCRSIAPAALLPRVGAPGLVLVDFSTSLRYRDRHIPGAWWAVRARLADAKTKFENPAHLVLTSSDGVLAQLAAPEATTLWPEATIEVLAGGNRAWFAADLPTATGLERTTTVNDDVWYKPYDFSENVTTHMQDYLTWELGLVEQIKRDPTIAFHAFE